MTWPQESLESFCPLGPLFLISTHELQTVSNLVQLHSDHAPTYTDTSTHLLEEFRVYKPGGGLGGSTWVLSAVLQDSLDIGDCKGAGRILQRALSSDAGEWEPRGLGSEIPRTSGRDEGSSRMLFHPPERLCFGVQLSVSLAPNPGAPLLPTTHTWASPHPVPGLAAGVGLDRRDVDDPASHSQCSLPCSGASPRSLLPRGPATAQGGLRRGMVKGWKRQILVVLLLPLREAP